MRCRKLKQQTRYFEPRVVLVLAANSHSEDDPLERDNTSVNSDGDGQQAMEVCPARSVRLRV